MDLEIIISQKILEWYNNLEFTSGNVDGVYFHPDKLIVLERYDESLLIHECVHYLLDVKDEEFKRISDKLLLKLQTEGSYENWFNNVLDMGYSREVADEEIVAHYLGSISPLIPKKVHPLFNDILENRLVLNTEDNVSKSCYVRLQIAFGGQTVGMWGLKR